MDKTVLVTGATGLLGRQVLAHFASEGWKAVGTSLSRPDPPSIVQLDVTDKDAVEKLLDDAKPSVVVHCAADRFPDSCAADPSAASKLNAVATADLANLTYARGIFLIYISTDYVFAGRPGEAPYAATAKPDPTNLYGATKLSGETSVLLVPSSSTPEPTLPADRRAIPGVILRVPVLYGPCPPDNPSKSVLDTIVAQIWAHQHPTAEAAAAAPKAKMDDWAQRFPTNTQDVARVCADVAALYLRPDAKGPDGGRLPRVLQFSGEERFTKWEMCKLFAEILGLPVDGMVPDKPVESEGGVGVQRPYDCHLDTTVLKELGIDVSAVKFETWWRRELRAFRH